PENVHVRQSRLERQGADCKVVATEERIARDIKRVSAAIECSKRGRDIVSSAYVQWNDLDAERMGRHLNLFGLAPDHRIAPVGQYRQTAEIGNDVAQEFNPFSDGFDTLERQARHVATGPSQACDEPSANWVATHRKHYRDDRRRSLGRDCCGCCVSDDDTHLKLDQRVRECAQTLNVPLGPTIFDVDSTSLDPAELMQPSHKCRSPLTFSRSRGRAEVSNDWQFCRLLRAAAKRPTRDRAAEKRDELPPSHCLTGCWIAPAQDYHAGRAGVGSRKATAEVAVG